jgi:hypothetical protein
MIDDTLRKIETSIQSSDSITAERKAELLRLLGQLKNEVASLPESSREEAQSIAAFADVSAREAIRSKKNPELLDLSLKGLSSSVSGFEKSHPQLVQVVNTISHTLSNLGI